MLKLFTKSTSFLGVVSISSLRITVISLNLEQLSAEYSYRCSAVTAGSRQKRQSVLVIS